MNPVDRKPAAVGRDGGLAVVALSGDIDIATERWVADTFVTALIGPPHGLVVDLSAVSFMDCAGIGALLVLRSRARRIGINPVLAAVPARVIRLLDLAGLTGVFSMTATPEQAVALAATTSRQEGCCSTPLLLVMARG